MDNFFNLNFIRNINTLLVIYLFFISPISTFFLINCKCKYQYIPTYNEKDNIVRLVETIKKLNIEQTFEILIMDNSPDGTYQFSKDKLSDDKNIKIVLEKNKRSRIFY